jgi:hypothetical protein
MIIYLLTWKRSTYIVENKLQLKRKYYNRKCGLKLSLCLCSCTFTLYSVCNLSHYLICLFLTSHSYSINRLIGIVILHLLNKDFPTKDEKCYFRPMSTFLEITYRKYVHLLNKDFPTKDEKCYFRPMSTFLEITYRRYVLSSINKHVRIQMWFYI